MIATAIFKILKELSQLFLKAPVRRVQPESAPKGIKDVDIRGARIKPEE